MNSETKKFCGEILQKLLKKYDRRSAKQVDTKRRITLHPSEIYKAYAANNADIRQKETINEAVHQLESKQLVTVKRLKYSDEIEKIYMSEDSVSSAQDFLRNQCGITPRDQIKEEVFRLFEDYEHGGVLVHAYCVSLRQHLNETADEIAFLRIEANLKMIDFLEKNRKALYVREASILVYGDSKWFQENNYEEICSLLRTLLAAPQAELESPDAILERFHIITKEQEILLKGCWKIRWKDFVLDTSRLRGGIAISSADIPLIKQIEVGTEKVMTIENKTSFQRIVDEKCSYLYLGGYANRHQITFLKKVMADNTGLEYLHFGDIDAGGFLIHQNLCETTGIPFRLYCMGVPELLDKRYVNARKPLTQTDTVRLKSLAGKEAYEAVVTYMLAHNCKLEQEIISLVLTDTA